MVKVKFSGLKKQLAVVALSACMLFQPAAVLAETGSNSEGIDRGVFNLDYNKYEVLANQGDVIQNVVPKEGYNENGKFIVLEHKKRSLGTSPVDISVVDSIMDRTYPGALLLADDDFTKNRPTALVTERKPIDITIDLPGLGKKNTVTVENPSFGTVNAAINEMIDTWSDEDSSTHTIPARTQYSEIMVHSKNQLKMGLNVDINVVEQLLGINFEAITKGEQKYMVASYKQIFYTVSAKLPNMPSDLFGEDVSMKELKGKGIGDDSPPVMVNNVAYGRTIYVVLKSNSQSDRVEAAFKALIKGQRIEAGSEFESILEDSSYSLVVLGGDSHEHNQLITTDFEKIRSIIKDNASFSLKNPGYPISYTSSFIKDNALAAVHNQTDYVETTAKEYTKGKVILDHSGAYVAQFDVQWDEVSYDENGKEILIHKQWGGSNRDKTAHYSTVINIPANSKNLRILARECTGLAWEWWRTVVDEVNVPIAGTVKVSIWGTTLHPKYRIEHK